MKWYVESWNSEHLEVEADELSLQDGALVFVTSGSMVLILADGSYRSCYSAEAGEIAHRVVTPLEFDPPNFDYAEKSKGGLAAVVDFQGKQT